MAEPADADPFCVTFQITPADYGSGVRRLAWALLPIKLFVVVMAVAAVGGVVAALLGYGPLAVGLIAVFILYAALLGWILFLRPGRVFRRRPDLVGEQTYCFSESHVSMTFVSGESRVKWSYFVALLEAKDVYVLRHPLKQLGSIIPRRAFKEPDAEARFRRLAQQIGKGAPSPTQSSNAEAPV